MTQTPADSVATPTPPPPTPRPISARAKRRGWTEPRVRGWLLAVVALLGLAVWILADEYGKWKTEQQLFRDDGGVNVDALVEGAGGTNIVGHQVPASSSARLSYDLNGKKQIIPEGILEGRREQIVIGSKVRLRVDPNDPEKWSARTEPASLLVRMQIGLSILPIVLLLLAIAIYRRSRVLKTWRDDPARETIVVHTRQSAAAPLSTAVGCVFPEGDDKRVMTVFLPHHLGRPQRGDSLWLIVPKKNPGAALAAKAYEG